MFVFVLDSRERNKRVRLNKLMSFTSLFSLSGDRKQNTPTLIDAQVGRRDTRPMLVCGFHLEAKRQLPEGHKTNKSTNRSLVSSSRPLVLALALEAAD